MNITPQATSIPIPTVANPPTDALRRENNHREIITKPAASQQSAAEKGVASERERARTPAQNNEQVDFENIRKQAELANSTISDDNNDPSREDPQQREQSSGKEVDSSVHKEQQASKEEAQEQQIISELKHRDKEVRAHEAAHASVGGATTGSPSYSFEMGPDGKKYAVEGEVAVDLSSVPGDPRATINKMQKVYAAALAPAQPSAQDVKVANAASKKIVQAQSELAGVEAASLAPDNGDKSKMTAVKKDLDQSEGSNRSNDFDSFIDKTVAAQETIAPSRSLDIDQRAVRIENFYSTINQAYEKPPSYQFELTA
ncbi:putative metalloprotease CJM1_0395 family protein [Colwelliaceae bacterium 6441]